MAKIYTRTGDDGTTSLGSGERVEKSSLRIACYGTVDELNSTLGVVRAAESLTAESEKILARVQNELFHLGCELSMPTSKPGAASGPSGPRIEASHVELVERAIDTLSEALPPLKNFILPGGTLAAAELHVARCVCRRAERELSSLRRTEVVRELAARYLNRLSDLLFVMARFENARGGCPDVLWDSSG